MTNTRTHRALALAVAILLLALSLPAVGVAKAKPTYSKDVAPILFNNCTVCHRPGDIAPMSLLSYKEVRPWVKSIQRNVVVDRSMPPWHSVDPAGTFANERRLDKAEIETISRWIKAGAPEGDPADLPPAPVYSTDWRLGEPDYILEYDAVEVAAEGPDTFHNLVAQLDFGGKDRWVKAIEVKPGNRSVVHHVIIVSMENLQANADGGGLQGWLAGWAAGIDPMVLPEGTGRLIKDGTTMVANMHFHSSGEAATDRTQVGLHFSDQKDLREVRNQWVLKPDFVIPPGAPNHPAEISYTFPAETDIYNALPHMHYRGKDMKMTLVYPDGTERVLVDVPNYDFNWQTTYELAEPIRVPAGTRIDVVGHWDNSADNPSNPDPTKTVIFGNESYDEMFIGILDVAEVDSGSGTASTGGR